MLEYRTSSVKSIVNSYGTIVELSLRFFDTESKESVTLGIPYNLDNPKFDFNVESIDYALSLRLHKAIEESVSIDVMNKAVTLKEVGSISELADGMCYVLTQFIMELPKELQHDLASCTRFNIKYDLNDAVRLIERIYSKKLDTDIKEIVNYHVLTLDRHFKSILTPQTQEEIETGAIQLAEELAEHFTEKW